MWGKRKTISVVVVVALLCNVAAVITLHQVPLARAFHTATTRQPEPYTELYFADPAHLPKTPKQDEPSQFSFVVSNHEAQDVTYQVEVVVEASDKTDNQAIEPFSLRAGESATKTTTLPALPPDKPFKVTVRIINRNQVIHFTGGIQ